LADRRTVAVVTGQQAGAFGGPLYTILKAVTTLQTARDLRERFGVPTVAVFWVDADDHDWQEVHATTVLDREFQAASIALPDPAGAGLQPVGSLALDTRVGEAIGHLEAVLAPTEFTPAILSLLRTHYRDGATIGRAFAGLMDALLGNQGLVVFEANDPAAKALAAPIFARALQEPTLVTGLVHRAGAEMAGLGHSPQLALDEDSSGLFYVDAAGRRPVRRHGDVFLVGDDRMGPSDLATALSEAPARFSPNVALRPLVQDTLFPTVCYVAGPSELAYQAQLGGLYRAFGAVQPLLCPRASVTVIDGAAARFLERYPLPLASLQPQDESALNRLLEGRLPPEIDSACQDISKAVREGTERIRKAIAAVDPTLAGAIDTTVDRVGDTIGTLQAKIVQAAKKKDDTIRRQFSRTRSLAFPQGVAQERLLGCAFFLNRYGISFPERLIQVLPNSSSGHLVIAL
jgi:bacillithiol biosynthesis cysteine-adding enzyme BshC